MQKFPPLVSGLSMQMGNRVDGFLALSDVLFQIHTDLHDKAATDPSVACFRDAKRTRTEPSDADVHQSTLLFISLTRAVQGLLVRVGLDQLLDLGGALRGLIQIEEEDCDLIAAVAGIPDELQATEELCEFLAEHRSVVVERLWQLVRRTADAALADLDEELAAQHCIEAEDLSDLLEHFHRAAPAAEVRFYAADKVSIQTLGKPSTAVPPQPVTNAAPQVLAPTPDPMLVSQRQRLEELTALNAQLQDRLAAYQRSKDDDATTDLQLTDMNRGLRARVRALEIALSKARTVGAPTSSPPPLPASWNDLQRFADERLAGNVVLTNKAIRAARSSLYEDIPFAYAVLLMLAEDYVPMRRGEPGARERFDAACVRLRIAVGPTGEAADAHRTKAAYRVQHLGKSLTLDLHVQGSSARDPRDGFRLYFAYFCPQADHDGYVVVGSFPAHLDNTRS